MLEVLARRHQNLAFVPRCSSRSAAPMAKRTRTRAWPSAKKVTFKDGPCTSTDYSDFIGVSIKHEKSIVSFGPKEDIKLVRAGPKRLKVLADSVDVPANFNVGKLSIEALIMKTVMDKIKPHIAVCQPGWTGDWCATKKTLA